MATATVANAYTDMTGAPVGVINFGQKITTAGVYTVSIPPGFWLLGDKATPSPAVELNYEILNLYTVSPRAGVVESLNEIMLDFHHGEAWVNEEVKPEFIANDSDEVYDLVYTFPTDYNNKIYFTFTQGGVEVGQITTPGTYLFFVPEKAFKIRTYGPNFPTDPDDFTDVWTPEIRVQYQIPTFPAPAIEPEQGLVEEFDTFTLTVTDEMELWMVDDMAGNYIYELMPDGTLADNPVCRLKAQRVPDANQLTLTVIGDSPVRPADGHYILRRANGLFSGMFSDEFTSSVSYEYQYEVKGSVGVETIGDGLSDNNTVYTFNGIRVLENASADRVKTLPAGFYIINGRKVAIR